MPILPSLCDTDANLEAVTRQVSTHGGRFVIASGLTLADQQGDFFCPAEKRLTFTCESQYTTTNQYVTRRRHYAAADCDACPLKPQCTRAKGQRQIRISHKLLAYRQQARENLTSEEGLALRAARSVEVETVFGHLKHNQGFRRFHFRGLKKVKTEWGSQHRP